MLVEVQKVVAKNEALQLCASQSNLLSPDAAKNCFSPCRMPNLQIQHPILPNQQFRSNKTNRNHGRRN
jgi:hypothetical protein